MLKKVVVIGPESTGKSTLCQQLSKHYNCSWCPEYAREYLLLRGANYQYGDLLRIARGQLALEDKYSQAAANRASKYLFIDTDMQVLKIWSEFVFNKTSPWISRQLAVRKYDLYLLCNTDLPWVADALREYPDLETRALLFSVYKKRMLHQKTPWALIEGDAEKRLQLAIDAVKALPQ